jgi:hypothetical protein
VTKIVFKDITTDSFDYTLKTDADASIGELITSNVTATNATMFFLLNNVSKWTGQNLTSTLTNTTQLNQHYYIQRGVTNVDLTHVICNNGVGYALQFNESAAATPIENFVVNHFTVTNTAMGVVISAPVKGLTIRNSVFKNQTTNSVLQFYQACSDILFDRFRLLNCASIVNSTCNPGEVVNVQFKNGFIDQLTNVTSVGTIDTITFENIYYANACWLNATSNMTFLFGGTYVLCVLRNLTLNFPTTIGNNAAIGITGQGKYILDNICLQGSTANNSLGQFVYAPSATPPRTVTLKGCDINNIGAFVTANASVVQNKFNSLYNGVLQS